MVMHYLPRIAFMVAGLHLPRRGARSKRSLLFTLELDDAVTVHYHQRHPLYTKSGSCISKDINPWGRSQPLLPVS